MLPYFERIHFAAGNTNGLTCFVFNRDVFRSIYYITHKKKYKKKEITKKTKPKN